MKPLLEALRGVFRQVAEPMAVLGAILEQAAALTGARRGLLVEVLEHGDIGYRVLHGHGSKPLDPDTERFSRQLFQRVLETGHAIVLPNALDDAFYGGIASVRALKARAIVCVPIHSGERIAALIQLEHGDPGHFTPDHVQLLQSLEDVAGPILDALRAGRAMLEDRERLQSEAEESRKLLSHEMTFSRFVGRSPAVRELEAVVRKAAGTDFPVLILGETGTGKSIIARVLHHSGARAQSPLVTVFCPSLERGMVEAELFGHRRGAFTGALADRMGKVQAADKGTLFLDEIGELPLEIQPKLLRLLQERSYERIGDPEERHADVRVIAATNRDLEVEMHAGRFRRDLFERLNFIPIRIPPLRERIEDIPLLLRHALDQTDSGRWVELSPEARAFLLELDFSWPGNVRHVEQLAARLTMEGLRAPASSEDVSRLLGERDAVDPSRSRGDLEAGLPKLLQDAERMWLEEALRRYHTLTRAEIAARLKISESSLYSKLRQYQLGE